MGQGGLVCGTSTVDCWAHCSSKLCRDREEVAGCRQLLEAFVLPKKPRRGQWPAGPWRAQREAGFCPVLESDPLSLGFWQGVGPHHQNAGWSSLGQNQSQQQGRVMYIKPYRKTKQTIVLRHMRGKTMTNLSLMGHLNPQQWACLTCPGTGEGGESFQKCKVSNF